MVKKRKIGAFDAQALNSPLKHLTLGLLMPEKRQQQQIAERAQIEIAKLQMLCEFHGIAKGPQQWFELALTLARLYEPGFSEAKNFGRPEKWTTLRLQILAGEFLREYEAGAKSDAEAARRIAGRQPWVKLLEPERWSPKKRAGKGSDMGEALLKQYKKMNRACKSLGEAGYHGFRIDGSPAGWRAWVKEMAL